MLMPAPFPGSAISLSYGATRPLPYTPTSPHKGVDYSYRAIGVTRGAVIRASGPGTVVWNGWSGTSVPREGFPSSAHGNCIAVRYDSGCTVHYSHRLLSNGPAVGSRVGLGTALGEIGDTGLSDGDHLHMEVWVNGVRVDPHRFFNLNAAVGEALADVEATPFIPEKEEETDMEMVVIAPNGVVVHFAPGAKHDFASPAEYVQAQKDIEFIRSWGGTDAMPLPDWGTVIAHPVTWEMFKFLCSYFKVPEGITPTVDAAALTSAQIQTIAAGAAKVAADALVAALPGVTCAPTATEIAAAVEAQLRDDFAAVAKDARSALDGATIRVAAS